MITWRMAAAWVLALVLATVLAWQIVGLADSQVGAAPPQALAPTPSSTVVSTTSTTSLPTTTAPVTSSVATSPPGTSPSDTSPTSSPTTSAPAAATDTWTVRTVNSPGGVVVVRFRPGEVELQAASPAPGFGVEIDDSGPPDVRVEFENDDDEYRVEVSWEDGQLQVEIDD